jgi:hypothetical protein
MTMQNHRLPAHIRAVNGISVYSPRIRLENEAPPRENDLFARPILTASDFGPLPFMRSGACDALKIQSLGPFRGGSI